MLRYFILSSTCDLFYFQEFYFREFHSIGKCCNFAKFLFFMKFIQLVNIVIDQNFIAA